MVAHYSEQYNAKVQQRLLVVLNQKVTELQEERKRFIKRVRWLHSEALNFLPFVAVSFHVLFLTLSDISILYYAVFAVG